MAGKVNHTLVALREIREEIGAVRTDLRQEIAELREHTDARLVSLETRIATELIAVGGTLREVRDLLRESLDHRARLDDHEHRIGALERDTG